MTGQYQTHYRWVYSVIGHPMWEWPGLQAILFYEPDPPFSPGGPPPMTDAEIEEKKHRSVRDYIRASKECISSPM